jgi:hypothetical protein
MSISQRRLVTGHREKQGLRMSENPPEMKTVTKTCLYLDHLRVRRPETRGQEYNAPCFNSRANILCMRRSESIISNIGSLNLAHNPYLFPVKGTTLDRHSALAKPYKTLLYNQQESGPPIIQRHETSEPPLHSVSCPARTGRRSSHMTKSPTILHTSSLMHAVLHSPRGASASAFSD